MKYSESNNFNIVSATEARNILVTYKELNNGGLKTLTQTGTFTASFGNPFDTANPLETIKLYQTTFDGEYCLLIEYRVVFGNKEQQTSTSNSSYVLINQAGQIIARYFAIDEATQLSQAIAPLKKLTRKSEAQLSPQFVLLTLNQIIKPKYINWLLILRSAYGMRGKKLTKRPQLKLHSLLKEMITESINLINYQAILTADSKEK